MAMSIRSERYGVFRIGPRWMVVCTRTGDIVFSGPSLAHALEQAERWNESGYLARVPHQRRSG